MIKIKVFVGIEIPLAILTSLLLLFKPVFSSVCTTPGCRKASSDVLSFIDPSVDPCQDFYKFTCGGIFKKTYEQKPASLKAMVKKEVDDQTSLMLIKAIDPSEPKAIQALKKFFRSCMDEAAVEKYGFSSIKRALGLLGGWPVVEGPNWNENSFSLEELLVKLRKMGYNFLQLLYIRTTADKEGQSFVVDKPIVETVEEKFKESYHDYMVNVAVLLGADKKIASSELQEMLLFKMKLIRIVEETNQFNKTTIGSIQEKFPFVNWERLLGNIIGTNRKVFENEEIYLPFNDYLENLENLLEKTSNRTLANYVVWEAIDAVVPYLPKEFRDFRWQYIYSNNVRQEEEEEPKSRLAFCKKQTRQVLRPTFEALYVREYFSPEKRNAIQQLVSTIKDEFMGLLNTTDIYDDKNKNNMLQKADGVSYTTGAPENIFDEQLLSQIVDEEANIGTNDFLTIASVLNRQSTNHAIKLGIRYDFYHDIYEKTISTTSYYSPHLNNIVLPAAILQGLYFDDKRPQYLNFGTIGTTLGYDLTHGFALEAGNYEEDTHTEFWSDSTKENFNQKAECLIQQASNFNIDKTEFYMDGIKVLNENICDYTGVEVAYRAYESWTKEHGEEKQLPGLTYTPKQLFWISTASLFCDTISLDELRDFIRNSKIAYPTFRTFGALSNNENFGKDFNCTVGSPMNPSNKCQFFLIQLYIMLFYFLYYCCCKLQRKNNYF